MSRPQPLSRHPDLLSDDDLALWIDRLVTAKEPESLVLEYKSEVYGLSSLDEKRELAKDVTSFANSQGGVLLLGVQEAKAAQGGPGIPKGVYGIPCEQGYDSRVRDALSNVAAPMLPQLRVLWVPKTGDPTRGVYLVWHPQSWLAPHMVQGYKELRYYRRDADRCEPVPMGEQDIERLYHLRLQGEQRTESFMTGTDFSLGYRDRHRESKYAYMTVCICPRVLLQQALDFGEERVRSWIAEMPFGIFGAMEPWRPASWGAYQVVERDGKFEHTAQLYDNGSLCLLARVARHVPSREDEAAVSFPRVVRLISAAYEYVAKLYRYLGTEYVEMRVRVLFESLSGCWLKFPSAIPASKGVLVTGDYHTLDVRLNVSEIIADPAGATKSMLNQVWRTFELDYEVPPEVLLRCRSV
jgi:hypothetical protein